MSSTRPDFHRQPLQIYQDPDSFDHAPMPSMPSGSQSSTPSPLQSIGNTAAVKQKVSLEPPGPSTAAKRSPAKSRQNNDLAESRLVANLNMVSMPPPSVQHYPSESIQKKHVTPSSYPHVHQKPLFNTFDSTPRLGKENFHPGAYPGSIYPDGMGMANFQMDAMYAITTPHKRALMDADPIQEMRSYKRIKTEQEPSLPPPIMQEPFPTLNDDGSKPQHSYATLIGMAILRAPNKRLTLAQIYKWISDTYSYYNAADAGWQNSIRHNLSLNKAFVKQERPKDDPGKGNYWAIEPGMEASFLKDKMSKKGSSSDAHAPPSSTPARPYSQTTDIAPPVSKLAMSARQGVPLSSTAPLPSDPAAVTQELSSDATIPASDYPNPDDDGDDHEDEEDAYDAPAFSQALESSPPGMMHSSPPVGTAARSVEESTPLQDASTKKRAFASVDDSGYFSSLNSSVLRGHGPQDHHITETDRTTRRGRAEEEIARLRGSSYDSPTKERPLSSRYGNFRPKVSSPLRKERPGRNKTQMLPPLTPASVKLRVPIRAPPALSPHTNLQMHRNRVRELVGSPERNANLGDSLSWSPAFRLDDTYSHVNLDTEYDVFADTSINDWSSGSPVRSCTKRPRLERAFSANVPSDLSDLSAPETLGPIPKLALIPPLAASTLSPTKTTINTSSSHHPTTSLDEAPFNLPAQDGFFGVEFINDNSTTAAADSDDGPGSDFDGVDILQGFQKIGAGGQRNVSAAILPSNTAGGTRPGFGRSLTSRF